MTETKPLWGIWIPINADCRGYTNHFRCSVCKSDVHLDNFSKWCDYLYCPFCGKEMDDE